eukprot:6815399-Alexandrium_andersonii.AAC.1
MHTAKDKKRHDRELVRFRPPDLWARFRLGARSRRELASVGAPDLQTHWHWPPRPEGERGALPTER